MTKKNLSKLIVKIFRAVENDEEDNVISFRKGPKHNKKSNFSQALNDQKENHKHEQNHREQIIDSDDEDSLLNLNKKMEKNHDKNNQKFNSQRNNQKKDDSNSSGIFNINDGDLSLIDKANDLDGDVNENNQDFDLKVILLKLRLLV